MFGLAARQTDGLMKTQNQFVLRCGVMVSHRVSDIKENLANILILLCGKECFCMFMSVLKGLCWLVTWFARSGSK